MPQAVVLLLVAGAFSTQLVAPLWPELGAINLVGPQISAPPHLEPIFLGAAGLLLAAGTLWLYFTRLNARWRRRPRGSVYVNWLAPSLFAAAWLVAYDVTENKGVTAVSLALAPAVALLLPLAVPALEKLLAGLLGRLGLQAHRRDLTRTAMQLLRPAAILRPGDPAVLRAVGLLHEEWGDHAQVIALLGRLEPAQARGDEDVIRALEKSYRAIGDQAAALEQIELLRTLHPEQQALARKVLDDYVALGRDQEALGLIESGQLKVDPALLMLRQRLYVKLGNIPQALEQIRRVALREDAPHRHALALYEDLAAQLPGNLEIQVNMGLLMMENPAEPVRREGARLIARVLQEDPARPHLARALAKFHLERGETAPARSLLGQLVEHGDTDPETYLQFSQMLIDEGHPAEAAGVLSEMIDLLPEDWRGHYRLARLLVQLDRLDEAAVALASAELNAPDDAEARATLAAVGTDLETRRRAESLAARHEAMDTNGDVEQRLHLIEEMLAMEWIDKALGAMDEVREGHPELGPRVEEMLKRAVARGGRSYRLRDYLGDLFYQQGRYDDLVDLYREMADQSLDPPAVMIEGMQKVLARRPDHVAARVELALAYRRREQWTEARAALDPLMEREDALEPEDKALWIEAAWRMGAVDHALEVAMPLARKLAAETGFMLMLIDILQQAGRMPEAMEVWRQAKEKAPDDERLRRLERTLVKRVRLHRMEELTQIDREDRLTPADHFEKAELHHELGEFDKAIVHYQRASEEKSIGQLALAKMAMTLCERGMFDLAQEIMEPIEVTRELAEEHPDVKKLLYELARTMERIKRPQIAVKFYKRLFRIDASYEDVVHRLERLS